jgi:hypothetical protein
VDPQAKQQLAPGSATPAEEREVAKLWESLDLVLLEQAKEEVINGLVLASLDYYSCQFYLKTNLSKHGIVALLCQGDPDCHELAALRSLKTPVPFACLTEPKPDLA